MNGINGPMEQFAHVLHYFLSFYMVLLLAPRFFFANMYSEEWERSVSNFVKMSGVLIILGHALALLRLFELLSLAFVLILVASRIHKMRRSRQGLEEAGMNLEALIYDYFDGKYKLKDVLALFAKRQAARIRNFVKSRFASVLKQIGSYTLLFILIYGSVVRMIPGYIHSALSHGDRYSGLRWIKEVRNNQLYTDGVIPQGFHVFWATLQEFTRIDTLFVILYTGAFTQLLVMLGLYFFLSRIAGQRSGAIAGLAMYTFLAGIVDPGFINWQMEAGPASFSQVFLLPLLYFSILYIRQGHQDAMQTTAAGFLVLAFMDIANFLIILLIVYAMYGYLSFMKQKSPKVTFTSFVIYPGGALLASCIPMGIEMALGKGIHVSFLEVLGFETSAPFLLSEQPTLVPLAVSVGLGLVWYKIFKPFSKERYSFKPQYALLVSIVLAGVAFAPVKPAYSVQVDWDASIRQYIRISSEIAPNNWMIVAKETMVPLIVGRGYHMNISYLVQNYDPSKSALTLNGQAEPDLNVAPSVFIFFEKTIRRPSDPKAAVRLAADYERWEQENKQLEEWIEAFLSIHDREKVVYYEDETLVVLKLQREKQIEETQEEIWGVGT